MVFIYIFSSTVFALDKKKIDQDSLMSIKLQKDGIAAGRLGDFELALNNFEKLYQLRQKMYGQNSVRLAPPLINIGIQYKNIGNFDKAIESYKKAEALCISNPGSDNFVLGTAYVNLGNIFRLRGDYNQALEYQKNAYRILKRDSVKYGSNFQDSKVSIAEIQLKLGFNKEAIRFAKANLKNTLPRLKPVLFDLIAFAYRNEGDYKLSELNYLNAINSWIKLYGEDNVELISEYLAYSSFLMSQKNYEKALLYSTKAKSIVLKYYGEKSTTYAEVQSNFGDYYYLKNT
jgi:tetratricopeptide (TPR) repeat protein